MLDNIKKWINESSDRTKCNDPDLERLLNLAQKNYKLVGREKKEYESLIDRIDERLVK